MRTSVDVHNFLLERDIPHELVPVRGRLRSPSRVAAVLGLPPEQVGRVVLLEAAGRLVAALVPSDSSADADAAARASGAEHLSEVGPDRVTELTGFLAEAVPPVALPDDTTALMDDRLNGQEVLYFAGGEPTTLLKIRAADLQRATGATVLPVAR